MYFRTFTLGANTEKQIEKAGFSINSFQEVKSFQDFKEDNSVLSPKDYYYDGSIWEIIDISDFSERTTLLGRTPIQSFKFLWNLFLNGDNDDRFGALSIIAKQHQGELISEIKLTAHSKNNSVIRKKILELKKSPIIANCINNRQIIAAIDEFMLVS
jgi:hypothetical protein